MIALVIVAAVIGLATPPRARSYQVVVHESNPVHTASTAQISALFLRRQVVWSDGRSVVPVDQTTRSAVRHAFSLGVHGRPTQAVQAFWRQKVFAGEAVPPLELGSDAEVLEYVRTHPEAVGYVSSSATVGESVRSIAVVP